MLLHEFKSLMDKLSDAFDRKEMSAEKMEIFFTRFKQLDQSVFAKMVEAIIDEEEKFPTIAKIHSYKKRFSNQPTYTAIPCEECGGMGLISAKQIGVSGHNVAFRCSCVNARKFSGNIQLWPAEGFEKIAASDVINPKGVQFLDNLPKPDPQKEAIRTRSIQRVEEFYDPSTGQIKEW